MQDGWRTLRPQDGDYPPELAALDPSLGTRNLWLRGVVPPGPRIAIVGTRSADVTGLTTAGILAEEAALQGMCVVSGGALGIDTAAHAAALRAGGSTLVVTATGPGSVYPVENEALFADVVEGGGGLLTENPPGTQTQPFHFIQRNRIIAALGQCVVVVQARWRSGALNTAGWARRMGVPVLAVPGSPLSRLSDGPNRLIARGRASILTGAVGPFGSRAGSRLGDPRSRRRGLKGPMRTVARLLGPEPASVGEIATAGNLAPREALVILLKLELEGVARRTETGRFMASYGRNKGR
jgi:DNA processing protein